MKSEAWNRLSLRAFQSEPTLLTLPVQTPSLQKCYRIKSCYSKPPSLWHFGTTALGDHTPLVHRHIVGLTEDHQLVIKIRPSRFASKGEDSDLEMLYSTTSEKDSPRNTCKR